MRKKKAKNNRKRVVIKKKTKREVKIARDRELYKLYDEMISELKECGSKKLINYAVRFGLIKVRRK